MQPGDRVVSFNGTPVADWAAMSGLIRGNGDGAATLVVQRGEQTLTLPTVHTIRSLNAARQGQRILVAPLFDGTQAEGAQDTTTVMSDWQGPLPGMAERFPMLAELGSARGHLSAQWPGGACTAVLPASGDTLRCRVTHLQARR